MRLCEEQLLREPLASGILNISLEIWQSVGWSSIVYLAAISGVNPTLYEAAKIDGAGRFKQINSLIQVYMEK